MEVELFGFGEEGVQLDYSATRVGSQACAKCHRLHGQWQQTHHMALTGHKVNQENQHTWFSDEALGKQVKWPANAAIQNAPRYQQTPQGIVLVASSTASGNQTAGHVKVDAVIGSGAHALGPIGIEAGRSIRELSVSYSVHHDCWVLTPGLEDETDPFGSVRTPEASRSCLECHTTEATWRADRLDVDRTVFGVRCERCHGPGSAHIEAVEQDSEQLRIFNPGNLAPSAQVEFCAQCHRDLSDLWPNQILQTDREDEIARHAGAGLMLSACYRKSPPQESITCLECHNPHRNIESTSRPFNASCLRCHGAPQQDHADRTITSSSDCVSCHMKKITSRSFEGITFTSHWIRNPDTPALEQSAAQRREYLSHLQNVYRETLLGGAHRPRPRPRPRAQADLRVRLAQTFALLGSADQAMKQYREALALSPPYGTQLTIAESMAHAGHRDEAIEVLEALSRSQPKRNGAYLQLSDLYVSAGRLSTVAEVMQRWAQHMPDDPMLGNVHASLGLALLARRKPGEAMVYFRQALEVDPTLAKAHFGLGLVSASEAQLAQAIEHYRRCLASSPDFYLAASNLAWILSTALDPSLRDGEQAVQLAEHAADLSEHDEPAVLDVLGAAYAETGRFADAQRATQRALDLMGPNDPKAPEIRHRLNRYKMQKPYRHWGAN